MCSSDLSTLDQSSCIRCHRLGHWASDSRMHGSAKVEAGPIMLAWPTCRGLPTNATPDQIPDGESCSEGYEDIVQVLQDTDACEFDDSSKFEVKGNLRRNLHF